MTTDAPIRVTVIGGYLGAGKTTLLNHVLRSADERVAVIVNDFGSVNIDAELVASTDGDTISLTNGCICCSVVDGFGVALDTVRASRPRPERLVIEASGVAIPSQVAAFAHGPGLALDGVVTVVDAETIRRQSRDVYVGDVIARQLIDTDLLVLTKLDLVDDATADVVADWLATVTDAPVVRASHGAVELPVLLDIEARSVAVPSDPSTPPDFDTWTESWDEPLDRSEFDEMIGSLPDHVVRAKGVVRFSDDLEHANVVQVVGKRVSIEVGVPWNRASSELVVIATKR